MRSGSIARALLVSGIIGIVIGTYGTRVWDVHSNRAEAGVIAILAAGFFAALIGATTILREGSSTSSSMTERERLLHRAAWRALIPPIAAGGLMIAFFDLTDRWNDLGNPVASQVALFVGILGAALGILADRITRWGRILIPLALMIGLVTWGDRLPLDSETTSRGEMMALLCVVILIVAVAINIPQIARGRQTAR